MAACEEHAGRIQGEAQPGGQQVAGREDEEDVLIQRAALVQQLGGVERPALIDAVQAVAEEKRFEAEAHGEQQRDVPGDGTCM